MDGSRSCLYVVGVILKDVYRPVVEQEARPSVFGCVSVFPVSSANAGRVVSSHRWCGISVSGIRQSTPNPDTISTTHQYASQGVGARPTVPHTAKDVSPDAPESTPVDRAIESPMRNTELRPTRYIPMHPTTGLDERTVYRSHVASITAP